MPSLGQARGHFFYVSFDKHEDINLYTTLAMASVPTPPKSIKNAGATQAVAQFVVGETAPDLTTMDTMATLKLLKDVLPAEHHGLLNGVINVETKFLRTALHMLANNKA
jgi:hypothetical protein